MLQLHRNNNFQYKDLREEVTDPLTYATGAQESIE